MPGPEHLTDLPAPPQEGRPMRPAGGEQPGLAGSPPGCWCSRPGGNRRWAAGGAGPAVAGLGTGCV